MKPSSRDHTVFVATFEDGRKAYFEISRWTLQGVGDSIAYTVARQHQDEGKIKKGKIVTVRRASSPLEQEELKLPNRGDN